jgi:predicted DNA-binding WGR domain protein
LVDKARLVFQQGKSDKVYEVDLCEVEDGTYVVNFRYGRRGATLREGTKTATPVGLDKARAIFDKLVASKTTKGYTEGGDAPAAAAPAAEPPKPNGNAAVNALLDQLRKGARADRPLERVVWSAGERRITEAEPFIQEILRASNVKRQTLRVYCCLWALGRCGGPSSVELVRGYVDDSNPDHIYNIAFEATRALSYGEEVWARVTEGLQGRMAKPLRELESPEAFAEGLVGMFRDANMVKRAASSLVAAYRIDDERTRAGVLEAARSLPHSGAAFGSLRTVFKAAEFRGDGELFGILARRFDTTPPNPHRWRERVAFVSTTRDYLRRRAARTIRRLGQRGSEDYVRMAVGVLAPFVDGDASTPRQGWGWDGGRSDWDRYAQYLAFNYVLYGNSRRYKRAPNGRTWRCVPPYLPGKAAPSRREEAHPELWNDNPTALLLLVVVSRCLEVHEFVAKALGDMPRFCEQLDDEPIAALLAAPYDVTARLGFELAKKRELTPVLRRGLAECPVQEARAFLHSWLDQHRAQAADDTALIATLVCSRFTDNREFARGLLRTAEMTDDAARVVIGRIVAAIGQLDEGENDRAGDIAETLLRVFARQLAVIGIDVVRDLLGHALEPIQSLAGDILLNHETYRNAAPSDVIDTMMSSSFASVRAIAAKLLGQLSDEVLLAEPDLFISLSTHELEELRNGIRPALARLAGANPEFARKIAEELAQCLLQKMPKGVPRHLVSLLTTELKLYLPHADKARVRRLLGAKSPHAQELGGVLLSSLDLDELTLQEVTGYANHELRVVREASWELCKRAVDRFRVSMRALASLLDSKWQDSREFGFRFVSESFGEDELTPEILIGIVDSVRPDVQAFGSKLITRYFREEAGHEYLAKLSEHPSGSLQLFVTNYLNRFATGDTDRIAQLDSYFKVVLSAVNRGGVAKQRVLAFLRREAIASEQAARIIAPLLARQSATVAISAKAELIATMVAIHQRYPDIDLPIDVAPPEARDAV